MLDALLHSLQMTAHLLLGVLRLSIDFGFEPAKAAVNICEFQTKIFTELINTLTYVDVLLV